MFHAGDVRSMGEETDGTSRIVVGREEWIDGRAPFDAVRLVVAFWTRWNELTEDERAKMPIEDRAPAFVRVEPDGRLTSITVPEVLRCD